MRPGINPISNSSVVEHPVWGRLVSGSRIVMGDEDFYCTTINTKELFSDSVSKSTLVLRVLYSYWQRYSSSQWSKWCRLTRRSCVSLQQNVTTISTSNETILLVCDMLRDTLTRAALSVFLWTRQIGQSDCDITANCNKDSCWRLGNYLVFFSAEVITTSKELQALDVSSQV